MKIIVFRAKTLLIICLIIGVLLSTLYTPAVQSVFSASNGRSLPIYSVQTEEKKIAIGINCAWDDSDIPSMLSCLAQQEVNATFFLLGEWQKNIRFLPRPSLKAVRKSAVIPIPIEIWTVCLKAKF